jgi:hypothetical protein
MAAVIAVGKKERDQGECLLAIVFRKGTGMVICKKINSLISTFDLRGLVFSASSRAENKRKSQLSKRLLRSRWDKRIRNEVSTLLRL